jgi:hypothetical protein
VVSFQRILGSPVGRVLLAAASGFTVLAALQSMRSVVAAGALVALGPLWISLGTLDQRTAAQLMRCEPDPGTHSTNARRRFADLEQAFAARADVTILLGVGWLLSGWLGLVKAAIAATG